MPTSLALTKSSCDSKYTNAVFLWLPLQLFVIYTDFALTLLSYLSNNESIAYFSTFVILVLYWFLLINSSLSKGFVIIRSNLPFSSETDHLFSQSHFLFSFLKIT